MEAGAGFGRGAGHVAVAHDAGLWEESDELGQQIAEPEALGIGTGVGGMTLTVESAFVADADAAAVEREAVGTHFEQPAMLRDRAVATDVEVVAYGAETVGAMVAQQPLHRVVVGLAGGRAVEDEVADTGRGVHPGTGLAGLL